MALTPPNAAPLTLSYSSTRHETLAAVVLNGLVSTLPLLQRFPEEQLVVVETSHGTCALMVWVHQVLGLTVLVKLYRGDRQQQYRFGEGPEQVIIDVRSQYEYLSERGKPLSRYHTVTLLSTTDGSRLFALKAEPDDEDINAACKGPLRGYCKRVLLQAVGYKLMSEALIKELSLVATAFAMLIARHLHLALPVFPEASLMTGSRTADPQVTTDNLPCHTKYLSKTLWKLPTPFLRIVE